MVTKGEDEKRPSMTSEREWFGHEMRMDSGFLLFAFEIFDSHLKFPFQLLRKRTSSGRRGRSRSGSRSRGGGSRRGSGNFGGGGGAFSLLLLTGSRLG